MVAALECADQYGNRAGVSPTGEYKRTVERGASRKRSAGSAIPFHRAILKEPFRVADLESKMRMILAGTLGNTGYCFLASRVSNEPRFGAVMMEALAQVYELGRDDERGMVRSSSGATFNQSCSCAMCRDYFSSTLNG